MWRGISVKYLGWCSKVARIQSEEGWGVEWEWEGFQCGRGLWSRTCRRSPAWSAARLPSRLTAQMIDDTSRAPRLYTAKQTTRRRGCQSPGRSKNERENVQNVQWQGTRKGSVTPDYDLVTVTAYSNFWTSKPRTLQPDPQFLRGESRRRPDFCPVEFWLKLSKKLILTDNDWWMNHNILLGT